MRRARSGTLWARWGSFLLPPDPNGPPGDLDAEARKLYTKFRKFLTEDKRWHNSFREAVATACRHSMLARLARQEWEAEGKPMLSEGYKGQPVEHVLVKAMTTHYKQFVDCLDKLGFTPQSRERLGVKPAVGKDDPLAAAFE